MKMHFSILFIISLSILLSIITITPSQQVAQQSSSHHKKADGKPDMSSHSKHQDNKGEHEENFDHESILGSKHESEEYGNMPPEEAKTKLRALCVKMDPDNNGQITRDELKKWVLNSFATLDKENSKEKMDDQDKNKDGFLSFDEYVDSEYGYTPEEAEKVLKDNSTEENQNFAKMMKDDKLKFTLADENKDGKLNLDEMTAFVHTTNFPRMKEYEIQRALEDFDLNKDGKVDEKEYFGDPDNYDNETLAKEKEEFIKLDKNGDKFLQPDEMVDWIMPGYEKPANEEVVHLFDRTDKDKNGSLSYDEIVNEHELWVGSQATDYGAHLKDKKDEL